MPFLTGSGAYLVTPSGSFIRSPDAGSDEFFGIWYANPPYGGPMATFTDKHRPNAIYVASEGKTFFVYGGKNDLGDYKAALGVFDHSTDLFSGPYFIGSITSDAHENPAIFIDENGYIYVSFGSHNSTCSIYRSTSPYDPTALTSRNTLSSHTYPQMWQLKSGEIIHVYRYQTRYTRFAVSLDDLVSWEPTTVLFDSGSGNVPYHVSIAETGAYTRKLHVVFTVFNGSTRHDYYYAYTDDGGATWKKADGTSYTLPITPATADVIANTSTNETKLNDIQLDSTGKVFFLGVVENGSAWDWYCYEYSSGSWNARAIGASGDHQFDSGALVVIADNDIRAILPSSATQANQDGGDLEMYQSTDGGVNWAKIGDITTGTALVHNFVKTVVNGTSKFRVLWSFGDSTSEGDVDLFYWGEDISAAQIR